MMNPIECGKILKKYYDGEKVHCPSCGGELSIELYEVQNKIGFATMTCKSCGDKIDLSRIKIPETIKANKV